MSALDRLLRKRKWLRILKRICRILGIICMVVIGISGIFGFYEFAEYTTMIKYNICDINKYSYLEPAIGVFFTAFGLMVVFGCLAVWTEVKESCLMDLIDEEYQKSRS